MLTYFGNTPCLAVQVEKYVCGILNEAKKPDLSRQMQYMDQPINPPPMTTRPSPQYGTTLPNESNNNNNPLPTPANLQNQTPLPPFIQFFREKIQATAEAALQKSNQQSDS